MINTWKVSWNKELYDYKGRIESYNKGEGDIIHQSMGKAKMNNMPDIGDNVYVSCNNLKIMKCVIMSRFNEGSQEIVDQFNIGQNRPHTSNNIYLKMKITETFDKPIVLYRNKRTWVKYKE